GNVSPTGSSGTQTGTGTGTGTGAGDESVGGEAGSTTTSAGVGGALSGGAAGMSVASDGGGGVNDAGGGADGGGTGGGPDNSVKPSTGCMKPANQALGTYVRKTITAQMIQREYFVRLPQNYDPMKPYRLMFTFPGCGGKGNGAAPLFNAPGADAIVVGASPDGRCFVYTADSKDVVFFDEMLKVLEADYCIDQNRIFVSGHSSGSWYSNVLGCQRSSILRAQGNISGCWPDDNRLDPAICDKHNIAQIGIHDEGDSTNTLACGIVARDRLLKLNGCSTETKPVMPSPCVEYQGCKTGYPVVWCQTKGKGHDRQDSLSVPAIYNFFAKF
ncbi:MAG TPA: hypothetical protein VJT73_08055, partial [Polyangiaceae bacterium]|nr:hypothetical protein [Polyangiaceae bacterium]